MNLISPPTKVLVIEDQTVMRENLVTLLELEGFEVASAENGRRGLALAEAAPPDLVLCDVMMPDLDGYAVLSKLREQHHTARVPFIFLTAKGERADIRTGMNLGADDYLVKPVAQAELLEAIAARLERQRVLEMQQNRAPDFSSAQPLEALGLTPREAEVLLWVTQGKGNRDIGLLLEMSEATAKRHLQHIFEKLGVETRTAAALRAIEVLSRGADPV
ncbi:MAG: response regulator transcription factor [Verrucomicrobia bacterium]|nr:response regulator transcription factor [Verrucomicrobiota bacterium]